MELPVMICLRRNQDKVRSAKRFPALHIVIKSASCKRPPDGVAVFVYGCGLGATGLPAPFQGAMVLRVWSQGCAALTLGYFPAAPLGL